MNKGIVYIIGAGCGKKDLITVKGLEKLKTVDAIVYDDLIDPSLLSENENAELFYMGKRNGMHSAKQEEICEKLIQLSLQGKNVARLKGGDPFVFGRGGEEILSLQKNNIPFIVIPGISSCIAIPSLSGIGVTHRNISRGFMVITGHTASDNEESDMIKAMCAFNGTIVILMGLSNIQKITTALIENGKDINESVAVISGGNSTNPIKVKGTLFNICEKVKENNVVSPAIIVIGNTVKQDLSDCSSYKTLKDVRVGITGTPIFSKKMSDELELKGALPINVLQTRIIENKEIKITPLLDKEKWIILTSGNGIRIFFNKIKNEQIDIRKLSNIKFGVIGKPTAKTLLEYGIKADLMPEVYKSEELGKLIIKKVKKGSDIVLLRADNANDTLPNILKKEGFNVKNEKLYKVEAVDKREDDLPILDYLVFSSSLGVNLFFDTYKTIKDNIKVIAIGDITANTLKTKYNKTFLIAKTSEVKSIVEAIEQDKLKNNKN